MASLGHHRGSLYLELNNAVRSSYFKNFGHMPDNLAFQSVEYRQWRDAWFFTVWFRIPRQKLTSFDFHVIQIHVTM